MFVKSPFCIHWFPELGRYFYIVNGQASITQQTTNWKNMLAILTCKGFMYRIQGELFKWSEEVNRGYKSTICRWEKRGLGHAKDIKSQGCPQDHQIETIMRLCYFTLDRST